jgi:hypothetical protein
MTSRGAEKMKIDTIGVVSKDHLDAHRLADGATRRFANDVSPTTRKVTKSSHWI